MHQKIKGLLTEGNIRFIIAVVSVILVILGTVFVYGQKFQEIKGIIPRTSALETKTNSLERYILVQEEALRGIKINQEETNKKLDMVLQRLIR